MKNLDYIELLKLYKVFMLISMERVRPYFCLVDFPVRDLDGLHAFARDFVIGFFEVRPEIMRKGTALYTDDAENFLERMHSELAEATSEEQADQIVAWVQGWPFDEIFEGDVLNGLIFFNDLRHRDERVKDLAEKLGEATLNHIGAALSKYGDRSHPIETELEAIAAAPRDNWEYLIHYMYNRGEPRDGTKVTLELSPIPWLTAMIHTMEMCRAAREIKALLTPDEMAVIDAYLGEKAYWRTKRQPQFDSLAEFLEYLDMNCPHHAGNG